MSQCFKILRINFNILNKSKMLKVKFHFKLNKNHKIMKFNFQILMKMILN